jgi:hypothetical protein
VSVTSLGERSGVDTAIMDTKKARACAPPGESLFSSLFNVAARGGKSPRLQLSQLVYAGLFISSSPVEEASDAWRANARCWIQWPAISCL